ncbi:MAG: hybrid sensor histidine kinase/response regulator, partial [Rhodobacteraceae bacterium]|nr:hybrid sensor histidine kinase/response regulator [Paracoccaceae bacterium]
AGVALVGYFAQTVQIHRQQRIERELAALRSIQAQKMEATGQLVGGVAHDFNNILTAVLGNLELYGVMEEPGERDHLVAEARQSAERAAELIRQLLAYSRQSQLQIETQSLRAVFEQVRNLSHRLLPSSIETVFAMPPEAIRIKVDQAQLITALINLLVNARDALEDGGRVSVEWRPTEMDGVATMPGGYAPKPGRYVEIAVQDNGPGIDPDQIERVTEPFFTTKPIGEGSGLGLSMVEGFARQSGGGLSIRSSEGGTRVSILLPLPERGEVQ